MQHLRVMQHLRIVTMVLAVLAPDAMAADPAVDKLMECMRANIPQTVRIQEFVMTSQDRTKGKRTLGGRLYAKNENGLIRTMIKIKSPPDLANAAYLIREGEKQDQMYVFLPALNRVRHITGGSADSPLFGTDLSYSDVKQLTNAFSGGAIKLEAPQTLDGRPTQVMSMVPRKDAQSRYNLVRGWIDSQTCVAMRVEFYEGATVRKRLTANPKSFQQSAKRWYASQIEMLDLKLGSSTVVKVTGVSTDGKLSNSLFSTTTFHIGG